MLFSFSNIANIEIDIFMRLLFSLKKGDLQNLGDVNGEWCWGSAVPVCGGWAVAGGNVITAGCHTSRNLE